MNLVEISDESDIAKTGLPLKHNLLADRALILRQCGAGVRHIPDQILVADSLVLVARGVALLGVVAKDGPVEALEGRERLVTAAIVLGIRWDHLRCRRSGVCLRVEAGALVILTCKTDTGRCVA